MKPHPNASALPEIDYNQLLEPVGYDFGLRRRGFVQILGAGLLIAAAAAPALAQNKGRRGGFGGSGPKNVGARIHLGKDGSITVLTGKVEAGQGARAEFTEAAAEELRVAPDRIQLIMADTGEVPDDGLTAGSGSTPRTVPSIRQAAAAARQLLIDFASKQWSVEPASCKVENGKVTDPANKQSLTYADLAASELWTEAAQKPPGPDVKVTPVKEWKTLGSGVPRPNGRSIVTGGHQYPSDISRPNMLYGKVLRPPSYGAKLAALDPAPVKEMKGVVVVRDEDFVGVAAPSSFLAEQAIAALAKTAKWDATPQPSSKELFAYLKDHAQSVPANAFSEEMSAAKHALRQTYDVSYVQHAPLEPRVAVAEWTDGKLTVWTGTQNPFGNRSELVRAFHLGEEQVRVIVPDFGAGFGGKHTGEAAVEAARLAKGAGKPVSLRWTREEEFTWAYFRPAAVILTEASLDAKGSLTSWYFININSGQSSLEMPYRAAKHHTQYVQSRPPLRHGSYRALAATANNFARESFMDECAAAAGTDPLEFRLAHLDNARAEDSRMRGVLEAAAKRFNWSERVKKKAPNIGVGLACGTDKGSYVAACAEIEIDPAQKQIAVRHVCQAYECGAILNPDNLVKQVQGAIIMGLGPALREEMRFENGQILNASFGKYRVPRFDDVPELDIELLDRRDLPSAGAGETPIIAIAPAIANGVFQATGQRIRSMPIRLAETKNA